MKHLIFSRKLVLIILLSFMFQGCATVNECSRSFEYPIVRIGAEGSVSVALEETRESVTNLGYSIEKKRYVPLNGVCYYEIDGQQPGSIKVVPFVQERMSRYLWQINNEVSEEIKQNLGHNSTQYEVATEIILQD